MRKDKQARRALELKELQRRDQKHDPRHRPTNDLFVLRLRENQRAVHKQMDAQWKRREAGNAEAARAKAKKAKAARQRRERAAKKEAEAIAKGLFTAGFGYGQNPMLTADEAWEAFNA